MPVTPPRIGPACRHHAPDQETEPPGSEGRNALPPPPPNVPPARSTPVARVLPSPQSPNTPGGRTTPWQQSSPSGPLPQHPRPGSPHSKKQTLFPRQAQSTSFMASSRSTTDQPNLKPQLLSHPRSPVLLSPPPFRNAQILLPPSRLNTTLMLVSTSTGEPFSR
jgi:hypothetical protein